MPRKPTLRRHAGQWFTQAGCRDGVYFGRIDEVPYQVARTRFGEYLAKIHQKPLLPSVDLPERSVAEICSRHLDWVLKNRSKRLFHHRKCLLNTFCNFRVGDYNEAPLPGKGKLIGELRAVKIARKHVEAHLEHRRTVPSQRTGKPVGDKALRHIVVALKATWNWAADSAEDGGGELMPPDHRPLRKLPRGYVQPKDLSEIELPTDVEIERLNRWCQIDLSLLPADASGWQDEWLADCSTPESQAFAGLMRAYHATGARTGELCLALVSDFMPRTQQICLGKHKRMRTLHNATIRNIQVDAELMAILVKASHGKQPTDPLFTRENGRPWDTNKVDDRLRSIRGVATAHDEPIRDHITPYSFRDLYISELLMIGIEPFKVAKMSGTSLKEIDRSYGHFFNHDLAEAQQRLTVSRQGRFGC